MDLTLIPLTAHAEEARWWKGNLHTHSLWSDGDDYPEMIADWYRSNDYNFLGISDHNILAEGQRWIHVDKNAGGRVAFEKYLKRFSDDWVEFFRVYRLGFQVDLAITNGYGREITDLAGRLLPVELYAQREALLAAQHLQVARARSRLGLQPGQPPLLLSPLLHLLPSLHMLLPVPLHRMLFGLNLLTWLLNSV